VQAHTHTHTHTRVHTHTHARHIHTAKYLEKVLHDRRAAGATAVYVCLWGVAGGVGAFDTVHADAVVCCRGRGVCRVGGVERGVV